MEDSERIKKQKELIEYIGRQSEKEGFQPVTARVMGLLMVMDKEEYTFDEIVEEMQVSKSAVSTALKNLEIRGVVEYITYPADRKRYFRFISTDPETIIEEMKKRLCEKTEMLERVINLKKDPNSKNAQLLKTISLGMRSFIEKLENLPESE